MATPLVRLAPLDLIRGFVAVGRRMSVTLAAEDLCLTQSAVSRQIHSLEDALGVPLFHRGYRSISFTTAGERLFRTADGVVHELQSAFDAIMRPAEKQPVTITAGIGVTGLWLLPRLSQLQRSHPMLDVRVAAHDKVLDLRTERIDLAIRYAGAANAPPGAMRLFDETALAAADPAVGITPTDAETGKREQNAYWLVQAEAAPRQDVRDVARWIVEQAQTAFAGAAAGTGQSSMRPPPFTAGNGAHGAPPHGQQGSASQGAVNAAVPGERVALS